jgi:hypothetical protein
MRELALPEVESQHDLRSLIDELEPFAYSLERPPGRACFELNSAATLDNPELLVPEFVRIVQALSPSGRSAWDRASRRECAEAAPRDALLRT